MAHRAMRDHRQATAWPQRVPSVAERRAEADAEFEAALSRFQAAANEARRQVQRFLLNLTDAEFAVLDIDDPHLFPVIVGCYKDGAQVLFPGYNMFIAERARRAALTGHERIAENARRRQQRSEVGQ